LAAVIFTVKSMKNLSLVFLFLSFECAAQNVGVGTTAPAGKLEVAANSIARPNIVITDSAYKRFGALRFKSVDFSNRYMEFNGYKNSAPAAETYLSLTSDSAEIMTFRGNGYVGINNGGTTYPLNVSGDVDIKDDGALRINGNSGNVGQVLTSAGDGQPTQWASQAFAGNTRFFAQSYILSASTNADSLQLLNVKYNSHPANITFSAKYITINKTGLYHIEVGLRSTTTVAQANPPALELMMRIGPGDIYYIGANQYFPSSANTPPNSWYTFIDAKQDIFIMAGTTIALYRNNRNTITGPRDCILNFSGYLISE
jgi:hypothetical protein